MSSVFIHNGYAFLERMVSIPSIYMTCALLENEHKDGDEVSSYNYFKSHTTVQKYDVFVSLF
jgi:hypothetical protein